MNWLLDLLFPKKCVSCGRFGSYICRSCFAKIEFIEKPVCPVCQRQAVGGKTHPGCKNRYCLDGLVVACRYRGPAKAAIQKVKYKWIFDIGQTLVDLIVANLWRFDLVSDVILVPVPLHPWRKKWRGFNQAKILAKALSVRFSQPCQDVLSRFRETQSQVGLKRDQRHENVKGVFGLKDGFKVKGRDFVLVDDVYTSGATMGECAKVLKRVGAKSVWAMVVALG